MAYYYNDEGDKIPVDDHSTPQEKEWARQTAINEGGGAGEGNVRNTQGQTPEEQQAENAKLEEQRRLAAEAKRIDDANKAYEGRFQYGGWSGGAHEAAARYHMTGEAAQNRRGETIDYSKAEQDRTLSYYARNDAGSIANLMRARAMGVTPSIAAMMADRQMRQATAEQSSAAASARGPAAIALAQQSAAANTAHLQSDISQSAQINAANERLQAEQAAFGAYSNMREGDMKAGSMVADQAQKQAGLYAAQREANDRYQLGLTSAEIDVQKAQLAAQQNKVAIESGATTAGAALAQQASQAEDARTDKYIIGGAGVAAGIGGAVLSGLLGGSGSKQEEEEEKHGTKPYVADGSLTTGTSGGTDGNGTYDETQSDERTKVPAKLGQQPRSLMASSLGRQVPRNDMAEAARSMRAVPYAYKPGFAQREGQAPGEVNVGPVAQEMEKSKVGATLVKPDPRGSGMRVIDQPKMTKALGGIVANQQDQIDELRQQSLMARRLGGAR
jgi:hypothetical protein